MGLTLRLDRDDLATKLIWSLIFTGLRRHGQGLLKVHGIQFVDRVYGLLQSGRMTESYLLGLIPQIQAACVEIYSHPAIAISGEPVNGPRGLGQAELDALQSQSVRDVLTQSGFQLTNYNQLQFMRSH
jgi:chitin disaccharide deacetylase